MEKRPANTPPIEKRQKADDEAAATDTAPKRNIVITALYKFVELNDCETLEGELQMLAEEHGLRGSLLIAKEGINGTIAGPRRGMKAFLTSLREDKRFGDVEVKSTLHTEIPFRRMRVRHRSEIVSLGDSTTDPNAIVGTYVDPKEWNKVLQEPDITIIDTRNDYEVSEGTFEGASDPVTKSFKEFPTYCQTLNKDKKIAMFCTGGIRCEKASSYLLENGFKDVVHLKGGILKYLEQVPVEESKWKGDCFVFDDRVKVSHQHQRETQIDAEGDIPDDE
eukprot:TRINITY_DN3518_c0_g2_i1.p1 TRINITY_DN3518_c0_g2~~TRINITY_DN3518_c0_g2_i1.p1  ORF type:complete len:299 (+),score=55.09 TRINITY_DN3518_c0_g2_i1:65-898(+)